MGRYRKYFKIYRKMQEMNIKSLMYYRADFLMMTFFTLLSQVSNLAVVGIIYTNIPTVGVKLLKALSEQELLSNLN